MHGADQRDGRGYRADIDGLRAVAVLSVVAFHLGYGRIAGGGYVGVDVFFVISGYLVGGPAWARLAEGRWSTREFLARRAARILPALAAMLAGTTVLSALCLHPAQLEAYGASLAAAALSVANLYFLSTSGYFGAEAATRPLLHAWSLSVEEQFYVAFPLAAAALRLGRRAAAVVVGALAAASLAAASFLVRDHPDAAFHLLPTRFWELAAGVAAARLRLAPLERRAVREAAAAVGIALVASCVLLYGPRTPFPGLAAVPPVAGAFLLLAAGARGPTVAGRMLASPPLVGVGLISYSLYLWHWPLIVLAEDWLPAAPLDHGRRLAVLAASLAAAWLSWRFVERPWRGPGTSLRPFPFAGALVAGSVAAGAILVATGGLPRRFPAEAERVAAFADDEGTNDFRTGTCFVDSAHRGVELDVGRCLTPRAGRRSVLVLGDSHAAHLAKGLSDTFPDVDFLQATASGCRPFPDAGGSAWCRRVMDVAFREWLPRHPGASVVLAARWDAADMPALEATLSGMRGAGLRTLVVGPVPRYRRSLPLLVARSIERGDPGIPGRLRDDWVRGVDDDVRDVAARAGVAYFSAYRTLCASSDCIVRDADGSPVQFDYGHLTAQGSRLVARSFPVGFLEGLVAPAADAGAEGRTGRLPSRPPGS